MVLGLTTELIKALNKGKTLVSTESGHVAIRMKDNKIVFVYNAGTDHEYTEGIGLKVEEYAWKVFEPKAPKTKDPSDLEEYLRLARLEGRLHRLEERLHKLEEALRETNRAILVDLLRR